MKGIKIGTDQFAALGLSLVVASLAIGFLAIGCGQHQTETASTETNAVQAAAAKQPRPAAAHEATAAGGATAGEGMTEATPQAESEKAAVSADSLPPDVVASASESLVTPGTIVEIAAEGSPDVVEVVLTDGIGKSQPLIYDSTAKCWRILYRVPLRTATDRVGLSVTAKNSLNRWHRVWVFLKVQRDGAPADSVAGS